MGVSRILFRAVRTIFDRFARCEKSMFVVSLVCGAEIALLCRQCVYLSRGLAFQNSGCGIENHLITTFRRAMQVNSDDISVAWGQIPDSRDTINGRWRLACYQDMQESVDTSKLYFLYDPVADDNCITSGGRKGMTCLSVFDTAVRCFVGEIPLRVRGRVKFLFGLKSPAPSGGTAFALITETEDYGEKQLHFWRLNLTADGMRAEADPVPLLTDPITVEDDVIVALREDAPELICMSSPGLTIRRVSVETMYPQAPTDIFTVPGAELSHFYDGFLSRGNVYFLSSSPDGHLDYSRVHILPLQTRGPIGTQHCQPDPQRGTPPARRQAAIDSMSGFILLAGGEIDYGRGNVHRLTDYWTLDLTTFRWNQISAQMPVPLIEPRLTTADSGNVYVWGDFDEPLPGMPEEGTHLRVLKVTGFHLNAPPSYDQSQNYSQQPYPGAGGPTGPYPPAPGGGSYPGAGGPTVPNQNPYSQAGGYPGSSYPQPNQGPYGAQSNTGSGPQQSHYPPQDKKNCTIS